MGSVQNVDTSWGNGPVSIGQSVSAGVTTTGGYQVTVGAVLTSSFSANLVSLQTVKMDTGEVMLNAGGSLSISASQISLLSGQSLLAGNDVMNGNSFNNVLAGYGGGDQLNGGAGTDTALYNGFRSQYAIAKTEAGFNVSGPEGFDVLTGIERIEFLDQTIAYDTAGSAGQAYRLYQTALNRAPDAAGLGSWIRGLDAGLSLHDAAQGFVGSAEFSARYGTLDNTQFVTQLYANALHRAPDAPGLESHVNSLNAGASRADVLTSFSESPENQAALIGVISNGMSYTG